MRKKIYSKDKRISFCTLIRPSKMEMEAIELFTKKHTHVVYFQSLLFFKACHISEGLTPYFHVAYNEHKAIVGIMLSFRQVQYSFFPLNLFSSRIIIWGGPLVKDEDLSVYRGLYEIYLRQKPFSIYTQVRNLFDQSKFQDVIQDLGFKYEEHLNILIDLRKTEEELWQEIHSKRRNEIRRSIKEGTIVEVKKDEYSLEKCYLILEEVYQRAKLPLPSLNHFRALLHSGNEREGLVIFVAKFENKIIGCMLCLAYGTTLFDYYAGAYRDWYHKYPNDLIPWEVFKWGKQNGFIQFDFGGAGKPNVPYGVREYKKKFGGETVSYGRFEKIHFPVFFKLALLAFRYWRFLKI